MENGGKIIYDDKELKVNVGITEEFGELQFEVLKKIEDIVPRFKTNNVKKILDLGCGTGKHSIYLAREGFEICAADISKENIAIVKSKAEKSELKNIECKELDMRTLPFKENSFDAVVCVSTITHGTYNDIERTLNEIHRVLKPKGTLITDILSDKDSTCGLGEKVENNTFVGCREKEEDIPHHYANIEELKTLFKEFTKTEIIKVEYCYELRNNRTCVSKAFDIVAEK